MKSITVSVPRFDSLNGWTNRILRINLDSMTIRVRETTPYVPEFLGARGIAAKIAWDEYPEPVEPFSPENPLMIFPGALTGTRSPYSGRANVCTFSPQGYPHHWFTRSNIGGHFGGELKRAGYDGIIVTGASEEPVRIRVRDDEVTILPADELWGQDTMDTLEAIESMEGRSVRSLVIGPVGERLSAIATIQTASSSACGHGGFGAVMGSKKLKAISVIGTGHPSLANPERIAEIARGIRREARPFSELEAGIKKINAEVVAEGGKSARPYACTEFCLSPCGVYYNDIPGCTQKRKWSGHWFCVGGLLRGMGDDGSVSRRGVYDWRLGLRAGFEMNVLSNRYGLNQWDLIIGMVPWLEACQSAGLISKMNGHPIDWRSPTFWAEFLRAMAYREGMGDAFAQGGWAAARTLHLGEDLVRRYYTGWGHAGHWDGHADLANYIVFPYWLVPVLQWLTDTRDPIPSGHGFGARAMISGPFNSRAQAGDAPAITWDHMRAIAARIYRDPDALDPHGGYKAKAYPGFYHTKRSVIKDCVPTDDFVFPLIYSERVPDHFCRVAGIDGPSVECNLFVAGTGTRWSEKEFETAAERVYTLERALAVRHWGRDRALDELVLPSFEYIENWRSPLLEERHGLDRQQFTPVIDEYYSLQGWDPQSGWPSRERLRQLDMEDVYDPMVEGAAKAKESLPEPPTAQPVPRIHD